MSAADEPARDGGPRSSRTPAGTPADPRSLLDQLRDANEQLVVSSVRAQELADQAVSARADAETANRLKDEFLAIVSHELRTPLNAVLGWARLLGGWQLDPVHATSAIRTIERNAQALTRIIDDLVDASRILGGTVRIEPLPVDLVAVIQGALDQVRLAAEAKGVGLEFSCPVPVDPAAGDALRLQQVVANLLSNAIKFTPSGGRVDVRLGQIGSEAEIQVADTGEGIDAAFLPRVFERFTQADASTTRRQGGLGLGLAIVRGIVEQHQGSVRAESAGTGHGATFTVRLPLLPGHEADAKRGDTPMTTSAATHVRLDGLRVVLVEDDADGRTVLALLLELAGAAVRPFDSVREALSALDAIQPHVIVSDIGLPGEDGFALIRRLRSREVERGSTPIPAIALTGYVTPEDRRRVLAAGFHAHVRKPVEPEEILATVASLAAVAAGEPK